MYKYKEKIAVTDGVNSLSYQLLDEKSNRLANMFVSLGVKTGDRVALLTSKSVDAMIAVIAILKAGAAFLPINTNIPASSIAFILKDCNISVLFADKNVQKVISHNEKIDCLDSIILSEDIQHSYDEEKYKFISLNSHLDNYDDLPCKSNCISNDLAYIIYTSGSTGIPKGVMITHSEIVFVIDYRRQYLNFNESSKLLSFVPLYFDPILNEIFCTLSTGGSMFLIDDTYKQVAEKSETFLKDFLRIIEEEKISVFFCVPSLLNLLSNNVNEMKKYDLTSLEYIAFGAGSCPVKTICILKSALPKVNFIHGYGLTETAVTACSYRIENPFKETRESFPLGDPIPDTEFYVLDKDLQKVSVGNVGELVIRGPHLMNGYWNNQYETDKAMILNPFRPEQNERVLLSGDLVRVEDDGSLIFVGRKDEQIKSAGYRIELGEIEMKICNFEGVKEAAVIAVPDVDVGNKMRCFISLADRYTLADLKLYCTNNLTSYTIPHFWIIMSELPKNQNGKIDKKLLKTNFDGAKI